MATATAERTKLDLSNPIATREAPPEAFMLSASPFKFAASDEKSTKSRPVEMLARTKAPIHHWYWGNIVHDFDGMVHNEKVILDYDHWEAIGYVDQFSVSDEGLVLKGRIESIKEGDKAEEVLLKADKGYPFESSIWFEESKLEWVPEGFSAEVNGMTVDGPTIIVRQWRLRAATCCHNGYDPGTQSKFSAERSAFSVLNWSNPMSQAAAKPADATAGNQQPPVDATQLHQKFQADLKRYTNKFGAEDGLAYFTEGKSFEESLEQHVGKLSAKYEAEKKRADDAEQKLSAAKGNLGEQPLDTGTKTEDSDGDKKARTFGDLIKPSQKA
jgi:hypothetical protein